MKERLQMQRPESDDKGKHYANTTTHNNLKTGDKGNYRMLQDYPNGNHGNRSRPPTSMNSTPD